ncbi:FkbM family methyltransferase [Arsenicicoccus piscis]|uniref:Methyltransferase FkbM domain-containing protein n=1 Tax=Arsenicicoccus piscis TaxID=673954 RepID=A0ABQ6HTL0_9MICO|nr:FkbM family methyltransferase [Arsenicicoccus piscis]MCH8626307.1 FkbM family methyltransferase [Arsenicicoccus piscis]GMA20910.1 hypothetical protein GCM10025862_29310 [Arsenicicoccus piscis]
MTDRLIDLLGPKRLTEVVDIGANPLEDEPPYLAMLRDGLCRVTGFEPQQEALERLRSAAGELERYLPYAIGDGGSHTLHVCASSGFSSLYEPDPAQLELLVDFPRLATVVERVTLPTTRLDDVHEIEWMDHLKIDVQGAELMVFCGGRSRLAQTTTIQVEVGFHRLYRDQPTFADVDLELREQGFVPQGFVTTKTWPIAPVQWADPDEERARQLVEADVLYVRDLTRLDRLDDEQLRHLALVTHEVYDQRGVALRAVRELVRRNVVPVEAEKRCRGLRQT